MSNSTYQAIAFLKDDSDFDIEVFKKHLIRCFPAMQIIQEGKTISLSLPNWEIHTHLADEPFVEEEGLEMLEHCPECPRIDEISRCKRRVEIWSPSPDPQMDYFNDYLIVCDVLDSFQGVIVLDPVSGDLLGVS
jgi:hypothetical protein